MSAEHREKTEEQLSAYLDGELTIAEREAVERHLAEDADLRRLLAELKETAGMVGRLPRESSPAGLSDAAQAMIERELLLGPGGADAMDVPGRPRPGLRWLATAAVVTMAATAGYFTFQQVRVGVDGLAPMAEQVAMTEKDEQVHSPEVRGPKSRAVQERSPRANKTQSIRTKEESSSFADFAPAAKGKEQSEPKIAMGEAPEKAASREKQDADIEREEAVEGGDTETRVALADRRDPPGWIPALSKLSQMLGGRWRASRCPPEAVELASIGPAAPDEGRLAFAPPPAPGLDAVHQATLDVEASSTANVYALGARTRAFMREYKIEPVQPGDKDLEADSIENARIPGAGGADGETGTRQEIRFRGRRSELVALISDLQKQDKLAQVQIDTSRSSARGWEQVVVSAGKIGDIRTEVADAPADFMGPSLAMGEDSGTRGKRGVSGRHAAPLGAGSSPKSAPVPQKKGRNASDERELMDKLAAVAGQMDQNEVNRRRQEERVKRGAEGQESQAEEPASTESVEKPPTTAIQFDQSSPWVDRLLDIMDQSAEVMDPDPYVEVMVRIQLRRPAPTEPQPKTGSSMSERL